MALSNADALDNTNSYMYFTLFAKLADRGWALSQIQNQAATEDLMRDQTLVTLSKRAFRRTFASKEVVKELAARAHASEINPPNLMGIASR